MKKYVQLMGAMIAVITLLVGYSGNVSAAQNITFENFDYISYANTYPDLQALGNNKQALYNHYINSGISEGRIAHAMVYKPSKLSAFKRENDESYYFDAASYAAQNPDLLAVFGDNKTALWNHYKTNGIAEGRAAYGTTDNVTAKLKIFDVANAITNDSMSEREKIKAAHDWIANNVSYDYQNYLNGTVPSSSHQIEGAMLKGVGVCESYTKTFGYFMYVMGIEEEFIAGGGHTWNRVLVDGNWLYVDCTWDDPVHAKGVSGPRYDYFMISYEQMSRDHTQEWVGHYEY